MNESDAHITVTDLTMAYGDFVIQRDLNFTIRRGDIFILMGGSGCGKSTLMRVLNGLKAPARGRVLIDGVNLWDIEEEQRERAEDILDYPPKGSPEYEPGVGLSEPPSAKP